MLELIEGKFNAFLLSFMEKVSRAPSTVCVWLVANHSPSLTVDIKHVKMLSCVWVAEGQPHLALKKPCLRSVGSVPRGDGTQRRELLT